VIGVGVGVVPRFWAR